MAIAERIYFFRLMKNITQKALGIACGFPEKNADVRIAQYESGDRTPKADVVESLARVLEVSPKALDVPDIDSYTGLMHTLFALEDRYGLRMVSVEGQPALQVDVWKNRESAQLNQMMCAWMEQAEKFRNGEISKEEYDAWRYRYPELDTTQRWARVPAVDVGMDDTKLPRQRAKKTKDK